VGSFVHTAGQIAIDPETSQLVPGDVTDQAEQVMKNLQAVLEAAGTNLGNVLKTTIFLRYMKDFGAVNEVYGQFIGKDKPARSTVAVSALPLKALVEIEVVALVPPSEEAKPQAKTKKAKKGKKKKKDKKKYPLFWTRTIHASQKNLPNVVGSCCFIAQDGQ
jgi:2-iminobutanoate/2-iminopropanoate deaminase